MINKFFNSTHELVQGIEDGSTIAVGGFGGSGMPNELIDALIEQGAKELTIVSNNAGNGEHGLAALLRERRVKNLSAHFLGKKMPMFLKNFIVIMKLSWRLYLKAP